MSTIWTFDSIENNNDVCTGKDYMKTICESLKEHVMKITNFENKKIVPLINEQQKSYEKTSGVFSKTMLKINTLKIKIILELEIIITLFIYTKVLHTTYVI